MKETAAAYLKAYRMFGSCAEVGRRFGVSRQYVHQVLSKHYPDCLKGRKSLTIEQEVSGT